MMCFNGAPEAKVELVNIVIAFFLNFRHLAPSLHVNPFKFLHEPYLVEKTISQFCTPSLRRFVM